MRSIVKEQKKSGRKGVRALSLLALLLCMALTLSGCSAVSAYFYDHFVDESSFETEQSGTAQQTGEKTPGQDDLHKTSASDLLTRAESEPSPYGSAGADAYAVSAAVAIAYPTSVNISTDLGSGSGVVVSEEGYILTCYHVVEGTSEVRVELHSGNQYDAVLVGFDENSDLAVVKITPSKEEPLTAAKQGISKNLVLGETVIAIGNPLGTLGGTVTHGIISATERRIKFSNSDGSSTVMNVLQTDTPINGGNSGGGLFNLKGELVGIVNAKCVKTGVENLGFAIPIDSAYEVEVDLIEYGYIPGIPTDGLTLSYLSAYQAQDFRINVAGIYVFDSKFCDEIQESDRITAVDGKKVATLDEYNAIISSHNIGDTVTVSFIHYTVTVTGRSIFGYTYSCTPEEKSASITLREYVPDHSVINFDS